MFDRLRTYFRDTLDLRQTNTRNALAEARVRQKQLDLAESTRTGINYAYGDFVTARDDLWDDVDGWGGSYLHHQRQHGENAPFVRTESELTEMRSLARWLCELNPFAIGALENLTSFVVGDGLTYQATTKEKSSKPLADAVQVVVDEFLDLNEWNELEQELFKRTRRDGESFVRLFPNEEGQTHVRTAEPDEITEQNAPASEYPTGAYSFGIRHLIETDEETSVRHEDVQTTLGYWLKRGPEDQGYEVSPEYMLHMKVNVDRQVKRGMSDFYATRELLEGTRKLLKNMREGEAVRAAIAGFWQYENTSAAAAASHVGTIKDTGRSVPQNGVTGKTPNYQKIESGTFINVPKSKVFIPPPQSPATSSQVQVVQAVLRAVGARWCQPEYMISGDASNANFASTLVSGAPAVRFFKRLQRLYKQAFLKVIWAAVRFAFAAGRFDQLGITYAELQRQVTIQAEAPKPEIITEFEDAQRRQIERLNGVLSVQTWQQETGRDPEQEMANNKAFLEETGGTSLVTPPPTDQPGPEFEIPEDGGDPVAIAPAAPAPPESEERAMPGEKPAGTPAPVAESSIASRHRYLHERYGEQAARAVVQVAAELLTPQRQPEVNLERLVEAMTRPQSSPQITVHSPAVHVTTPPVTVHVESPPAQNITLPEQQAPVVNVTMPPQVAPVVNVTMPEQPPPVVHVTVPDVVGRTVKRVHRDGDGNITEIVESRE